MNSTFSCVPMRVPIIECHCELACLKSSHFITLEHSSVSTTSGEKVFLCLTVHTVHQVFFLFIFMWLACERLVNSEYFTVHFYRLIDVNVIVCCEEERILATTSN